MNKHRWIRSLLLGTVTIGLTTTDAKAAYFKGLGDLPGGSFNSIAFGISADGSTVVGSSSNDIGEQAFIYDSMNGMESIQDILTNAGSDLTGWTLLRATVAFGAAFKRKLRKVSKN